MPRPTSPHPDAERKSASPLHPRNRHLGRYDFPRLIAGSPELERFVILNPYGRQSIDFADPAAVKAFNRALLQQFYDVREWDIPDGYLCPPIPGRADYLHYLADLLGASHDGLIPRGPGLRALDVGTGANCIYPLLGHHEYGWRFVGADIDPQSLASAAAILAANPRFAAAIELRRQPDRRQIFQGLIGVDERFDMTLCNPPFHASLDEATR
ncbi:23S rRNA (adenine(1618)-N(6))-methyltransferase RlmF, partial [Pseudomonas aeruginosa]|nr:23S rRNA (adenine(1618)-N(6))-methyltransferase RlmF [Pseudomonas aeruginosa]